MLMRICVWTLCLSSITFGQSSSPKDKPVDSGNRNQVAVSLSIATESGVVPAQSPRREFRLLATNKTSTMQKEMNEAAAAGYHYEGTMGGETSFGGSEVVVIMSKDSADSKKRYDYKLLATSKTSTMQRELQEAGNAGFEFKGQSVYSSTFGGKEVVVILERDAEARTMKWEYKLLATKKTSTMQKELNEAGSDGFVFVGVTVGDTLIGGKEVVSILRRPLER
ncbi:MAG: hypothetical protein WBV94_27085 [Blastocatellia bacterium]